MIFTEGVFFVFFILCFSIYWCASKRHTRHIILLVASFIFYGWWDWRFLGLIGLVIVVSWAVPLIVHRMDGNRKPLVLGIVFSLAVLAFFKYSNFFLGSLQAASQGIGVDLSMPVMQIILPVGVSFYVFQAISYMVDVARGDVKLEKSIVKVALYIAFFPQLVAGPIVRATEFMPQLDEDITLRNEDLIAGSRAFLIGFLYKALFADSIAVFVDTVFADLAHYSDHVRVMASFGFYSQIYFDFAGYSLMAIGIARLLGYRLPENFRFPYRATSIIDFWRLWHMSLSRWLRDYLYIPLGGSRFGVLKRYRNLMTTMLLGGLWHGASWAFVLWGGMHGLALAVNHGVRSRFPNSFLEKTFLGLVCAWALTQLFVLLVWVPFRAVDISSTMMVYQSFLSPLNMSGDKALSVPYLLIFGPILVDSFIHAPLALKEQKPTLPSWAYWLIVGALFALALQWVPLSVAPFIYFQF